MTFDDLIAICKPVAVHGTPPDELGDLTQDSRQAGANSVFIAVPGTEVDGHMFIENAVSKGASVVICEDPEYAANLDVCIVEVRDTRDLVSPLAQAFEGYPAEELTLIGVTGTNGKTTVVTLVYQILRQLGVRASMLGTTGKRIDDEILESLLTTADPVELAYDMRQMVDAGSTHLVMEVSSHALDQKRVAGLDFEVAAFTNLSHDHLDYHETITHYARSKKLLFDDLKPEARAVINGDDERSHYMIQDCRSETLIFSFDRQRGEQCMILSSTPEGLHLRIGETECRSPLVGTFNAYNVAEAFLICEALGLQKSDIAKACAEATGAAGRLERVQPTDDDTHPVVLVDYAHTPDALTNVLETLRHLKSGSQELHLVFGCGGNRDKAKRSAMAKTAERFADRIIVTSDNPRNEDPDAIIDDIMKGFGNLDRVERITDRREAIEQVIAGASPQTLILIAGKGHETYQEVKGVKHDFDDRVIARQALQNRNGNPKPEEVS